jgi:ABC-2 type transport system ATP-binding protein
MDPGVVIDVAGLGKDYGAFRAVAGLDLQVRGGERFALLGNNGAGKTTTIRMLMGILRPSAGRAAVCGYDCFSERHLAMRHVGYLPDEPIFYDYLRGSEILRFVAEMHGLERQAGAARARELVARLDLADATDEYAVNYSKGMKKKLSLACALMHRPQLLILDEPSNGLDPHATRALLEMLREEAAGGTTVFFSTHLLDQAERLCSRIGIVSGGRLAEVGTLDELHARHPGLSLEEIFFSVTGEPGPGRGAPAPADAADGAPT